jgi:hypothetical protein
MRDRLHFVAFDELEELLRRHDRLTPVYMTVGTHLAEATDAPLIHPLLEPQAHDCTIALHQLYLHASAIVNDIGRYCRVIVTHYVTRDSAPVNPEALARCERLAHRYLEHAKRLARTDFGIEVAAGSVAMLGDLRIVHGHSSRLRVDQAAMQVALMPPPPEVAH